MGKSKLSEVGASLTFNTLNSIVASLVLSPSNTEIIEVSFPNQFRQASQ